MSHIRVLPGDFLLMGFSILAPKPVSSRSSRRAAFLGVSPIWSMRPPGKNQVNLPPYPTRFSLVSSSSLASLNAKTETLGGLTQYSYTVLVPSLKVTSWRCMEKIFPVKTVCGLPSFGYAIDVSTVAKQKTHFKYACVLFCSLVEY